MTELYIGLMSGTSCDAIDAALVEFNGPNIKLLHTHHQPIEADIRNRILEFSTSNINNINNLGELKTYLGQAFAEACLQLLFQAQVSPDRIHAIGSHGQNIRHHPNGNYPFTLQIGDPNIIAARTGITTVADFRRRDIALGGQGAPLAPAFHAYLLQHSAHNQWVLNIGGIANLTWLPAQKQQPIIGFDTGPGNCLMDSWCYKHTTRSYDHNGEWASQATADLNLVKHLLNDPYFALLAPKSTGREHFNLSWLEDQLHSFSSSLTPVTVQASLLELTVRSICQAIDLNNDKAKELWVCGGGSRNTALMQRLTQYCDNLNVLTTDVCGIPPEWIEAAAFAWLARQTLLGLPGNIPSVTGASCASILGAIYPANR